MIKKIAIEQLKLGMYVHDLNCDWLDHGFIRNQFLLKKETDLLRIHQLGVRDLYINTVKGADASPAPSASAVEEKLEQELAQLDVVPEQQPVSLKEELGRAQQIHQEAIGIVSDVLAEARLGQQINLEHTNPVVTEMVGSIFRNQNALLALSRIRQVGRYTFEHSVNVAVLMVAFARALNIERTLIHDIGLGALLHDIGKVLVPPEILNKPGALTDAEFTEMRNHVVYTRDLLAQVPGLPPIALAVAAEHHERVDGSGYPQHKSGAEISLYGQMAAIADVYDALTTDRVYHKALEPHQALRKLLEWSNHHFDPTLVQQFIRCVGIYPVGTLVRLHSGRLGVVVETGRQGLLQPVVRVIMDVKHRTFLTAQDVDLSQLPAGSEEKIVAAESAAQWGIDPVQVLRCA